jgi:hypothetical protein
MYQIVDVTPGKTYWFSAAIGVAKPLNWSWVTTLEEYDIKVLSTDGNTVHSTAIIKCDPTKAVNFNKRVQGTITVPSGVTQIRFQIDKPSFDADISIDHEAPIFLIDDCELRIIPN